MKNITRQQMLDAVKKNVEKKETWYETITKREGRNSYASRGARTRMQAAQALLKRLENGDTPTTQEVVGYFGEGARFQAES
jgi:hypothetical protein